MGFRSWLVSTSVLVAFATTAHAQAPGEVEVVPMTPVTPVGIVQVAPQVSPMANRWSVGLSMGSVALAPKDSEDATHFAIGELAVRFRATPHLEIELALGGGRQHEDGMAEGDLEVDTATIGLRYRFLPYRHWNWYLLAGLGAASVTSHDASDDVRHDATRGVFEAGIGTEYRWTHLAISAELRGIAMGEPKATSEVMPQASTVSAPAMTTDTLSGGQLTIGASYYF